MKVADETITKLLLIVNSCLRKEAPEEIVNLWLSIQFFFSFVLKKECKHPWIVAHENYRTCSISLNMIKMFIYAPSHGPASARTGKGTQLTTQPSRIYGFLPILCINYIFPRPWVMNVYHSGLGESSAFLPMLESTLISLPSWRLSPHKQ